MISRTHPVTRRSLDAETNRFDAVERAARAFVDQRERSNEQIVLAVSGGSDSMALMHATARAVKSVCSAGAKRSARILTFDHGTGDSATAAAELVAREATELGFDVRVGRGSLAGRSEAAWRSERWRFFRTEASGDVIATAHTLDDHVETVVMRAMRGAGARGLAGLAANAPGVARPFLHVNRETIRAWCNARGVPFVEDPSNSSRRFLRNRIRLDLLPSIDRVRPSFAEEMLAVCDRAAGWRSEVDALVTRFVLDDADDGLIRVAREELATYDSKALCVLWPAIAARAHVTLDRRGTFRLAQFTTSGARGARMQLSGGVEVYRHRDTFVIRHSAPPWPESSELLLSGVVRFGGWRFRPIAAAETPGDASTEGAEDTWVSDLPSDRRLSVRAWQAADRMRVRATGAARRVKRFFGDARIPGPRRSGWPVVLADDEIVWIPGVRRTDAASERSGRPVVRYACERYDGGLTSG